MTASPGSSPAPLAAAPGPSELLIVGLSGPRLEPATAALLASLRPGGVILFGRNLESVEQLGELIAEIRRAAPEALLYSDSEGGRVDRLAPFVGPAPAAQALAGAAAEVARDAGRWIGESLRRLGYDVDFAPVVDLDRGMEENALDGRYFGRSAEEVTARGGAFLAGLHAAGIGGCLKHFPGLGPSRGDTHFSAGLVEASARELAEDLAPFAALGEEAGMVMVAHATYPALDPEKRPASLSAPVAGRLLRERLGFTGVAVADDLEMNALEPWGSLADRAEAALVAGCDLFPVCHTLEEVPAVVERLGRTALRARVEESRARLARYRRSLAARAPAGPPPDLATVRTRLAALHAAAAAAATARA